MNLKDLVKISSGNLWRMKLRAFLTVSGVIIAIASFISMLSFGIGMQTNVSQQFEKFGLLNTMQVYPVDEETADSLQNPKLDTEALEKLSKIAGVRLAFPYDTFDLTVTTEDTSFKRGAQALPESAAEMKYFSRLKAGDFFTSDSSRQVIVLEDLVEPLGYEEPDSLIGKPLYLSVKVASIDSGIVNVLRGKEGVFGLPERVEFDSLGSNSYRAGLAQEELEGGLKRFLDGYLNHRSEVSDTLVVSGVIEAGQSHQIGTKSIYIPAFTAKKFESSGPGDNPADIFTAIQSGQLFGDSEETDVRYFPKATLDFDPHIPYQTIKDSVEALGFDTFSYAEEFEEMRKFFVFFDMGLGVIGFIALVVASLGIINTLVMSITERTREIGVMKSLGADDRDIHILFLVESGVIGISGSIGGIILGWIVTRIAEIIVKAVMINIGATGIENIQFFMITPLLMGTSILFGLGISVAAGLYPAARASRINPVEALRME